MINELIYKQDIKAPVVPRQLSGRLFKGDNNANRFSVELMDGNDIATPEAGTVCTGKYLRADGYAQTVSGMILGNKLYFDLPAAAYEIDGRIGIFVSATLSGKKVTWLAVSGTVSRTDNNAWIDPDHVVPDTVEDLIAEITAMQQATAAANAAAASASRYTGGRALDFELGDLYVNSEGTGTYYNSVIRLRTPQNTTVVLGSGDVAQFIDGSGCQYIIYKKDVSTGKYTSVTNGWISTPYTITEDMQAVILLRYTGEPEITDPAPLIDNFQIWRADSDHLRINSIETAVLYSEQSLTTAQKTIARGNIGAAAVTINNHTLVIS